MSEPVTRIQLHPTFPGRGTIENPTVEDYRRAQDWYQDLADECRVGNPSLAKTFEGLADRWEMTADRIATARQRAAYRSDG